MSNVIAFLERMGQDGQLRYASRAKLEQELIDAQIDPAVRQAICDASQSGLEAVLGATANVCCMVQHPEDDDVQEGEDVAPVAKGVADTNQSQLEALLGATANVCCMVHHSDDNDVQEGEDVAPAIDRLAG